MDDLRAQFPVFERVEYLNAGTNGPIPEPAYDAAVASLRRQLEEGRSGKAYFDECVERIDLLRGRIAALIGVRHRRACAHRLDDGRRKRCAWPHWSWGRTTRC